MKKIFLFLFCFLVAFFLAIPSVFAVDYGKMIIIGDSYSRGFNTNNDATDIYANSWPNKMISNLGLTVDGTVVDQDLGRRGGAGFCAVSNLYSGESNVTFNTQLKKIVSKTDDMNTEAKLNGLWLLVDTMMEQEIMLVE